SGDAPFMNATYKLVELNIGGINRFTTKLSEDKISLPGSKQVFREREREVIARSGECGKGEALLRPVILGGRLIEPLPTLDQVRCRAADAIARLPQPLRELEQAEAPPIVYSAELQALFDRTRRNLAP